MAGDYGQPFSVPMTVKQDPNVNRKQHIDQTKLYIAQELSESGGSEPANDYDGGEYSDD